LGYDVIVENSHVAARLYGISYRLILHQATSAHRSANRVVVVVVVVVACPLLLDNFKPNWNVSTHLKK
jgi:hypothetical protein